MKKIFLLITIIFLSIFFARSEPPSNTAVVHATDSKPAQQPKKEKVDIPPELPVEAPKQPETKPEPMSEPVRVLTQPQQWMQAAGIAEADWQYADCIISGCGVISPEGNWDGVQKWNTAGSGAYGLCQSLPGNKMAAAGADWQTNPVTQLKWCTTHANNYGGWKAAWEFRQCTGVCYSTFAKRNIFKDHTWW